MPVWQILYKCTLWIVAVAGRGFAQEPAADEWILLRDLQVLREPVREGGPAGVVLQAGRVIGWEQIVDLRAAAIPPGQARAYLERIGEPAARLEWRLAIGDIAGAAELGPSLSKAIEEVPCAAGGLLALAEANAEWGAGNWDRGLQAYLRALGIFAGHPDWQARLPTALQLPASLDSEAYRRLPPLWLDPAEIAQAWQRWAGRVAAADPASLSVMQEVYLASLAIAAGDAAAVAKLRDDLQRRAPDWAQVLAAQQTAVAGGRLSPEERTAAWTATQSWGELPRATGRYWLALEQLRDPAADFERAALRMLDVPASLGTSAPELSAAALAAVATAAFTQRDPLTGQKLLNEIQTNYPQTWTARHWSTPESPPPVP